MGEEEYQRNNSQGQASKQDADAPPGARLERSHNEHNFPNDQQQPSNDEEHDGHGSKSTRAGRFPRAGLSVASGLGRRWHRQPARIPWRSDRGRIDPQLTQRIWIQSVQAEGFESAGMP